MNTTLSSVRNAPGAASPAAEEERLNRVFMALADPTRRAILARLAAGDASVSELTTPFAMSQPAISKHLKVLEAAGLISRSRAATARLSHLEAAPLEEASVWVENYRRFWGESFDKLDVALAAHMATQTNFTQADTLTEGHTAS
ncbi:metalloregulator ArsR/SmtB family transcription factor [Leifsonia sp. Root4]|uniref:ArsR/SmtB family transcription factor n=1 Tax=Leifsonia sp. Root4 TaxID=1736525 RepID=UPI000AD4D4FC|nr:metalloregulator ArsR/SmtB family transcription factor [Leifsonia sp. Root4]